MKVLQKNNLIHLLFSFEGKVSRTQFIGILISSMLIPLFGLWIGLWVITFVKFIPDTNTSLLAPIVLLGFWTFIAGHVKRFRDIGMNPWFFLLYLVPIINFIVIFALIFIPSKKT